MSRKVFCKKYQKEMEGLLTPPYPGVKGQDIFDNISKHAWLEWQQLQTRLINEKGLSMINSEDRKYLTEEMDKFFANKDHDEADGYVPEN
ncbi:MAG: oxidative damage protection protein [SAR86 cluster bacterium]|uniref:Probable Fe(2+)-trafficking protein n=1 Tax=SAR86 cluster bacterium TaxID=2030880 RepID=A0A2A5CJN6_9GAMM|nr:MAG: oxidative damage protection protein [SAR86 cluster bacterium]